MDRANKNVINLNLKDLSDVPSSYDGHRGNLVAVKNTEDGGKYVKISEFVEESGLGNNVNDLKARIQNAENRLATLSLENDILLNRTSQSSGFVSDIFKDWSINDTNEFTTPLPGDTQKDHDWNNNWKYNSARGIFQQGFMRPQKQYHMLEIIDEFNLIGVGIGNFTTNISNKCDIDYDGVNNCYWLMVNGDVAGNGLGNILKISPVMGENKVMVLSEWYLAAQGASTSWTGLCSDGSYLYFSYTKIAASTFYKIKINSDGTLGKTGYTKKNGELIDLVNSVEWIGSETTANSYCCSISNYSATEIMYMYADLTTTNCSIKFRKKSDGSLGTTPTITGFYPYVGDTSNANEKGIFYDGTNLWIAMDGMGEDKRYIQKFNLTTDVKSNAVFKSSGRWETSRFMDGNQWTAKGICIGHHGDIMEVVNTGSNGQYIARRALANALWSENQVSEEKCLVAITSGYYWSCLYIDNSGNYYVGYQISSTSGVFKKFKNDGTVYTSTMPVSPLGMCSDGTDVWWLILNSTLSQVYKGTLASLSALVEAGTAITPGTNWGTLCTGTSGNTLAWYDIAYDYDSNIVYILSDGDDKIKSLTANGATLTNIQNLPAAPSYWIGIAYKNGNLYLLARNDTALATNYCSKIWVVPKNTLGSTTVYRKHIYQDPNVKYNGVLRCMHFDGNDLMILDEDYRVFHSRVYRMKVLEDPDVMQLHVFMDNYNVLLSTNINAESSIVERYFEPDQFADVRDVPDKYYCAVGYNDEGFSVLHLESFLSGRSSTGKDRYDVTKIRTWHFKRALNNAVLATTINPNSLFIEKDMIFMSCYNTSQTLTMVDLKSGKIFYFGDTYGGNYYNGTITERNDGKGTTGTANPELYTVAITGIRTHVRTFSKEDVSDYNFDNPKTYVLLGTASGGDLLIIDWDENGNRTPVKIWNNIFNATGLGWHAFWIAPSGKLFAVDYSPNGGLYVISKGNASGIFVNPFIWEINADTLGYTAIHATITGGYGRTISPNSRCWRTTAGQWRHQLVVGILDASDGNGNERVAIIDVENILQDTMYYYNSAYWYCAHCDTFEDIIFSTHGHYSTGTPGYILLHKKLRFDDGTDAEEAGTWTRPISGSAIAMNTRPRFFMSANASYIGAAEATLKYAKDFGILMYGPNTNTGAFEFLFFPQVNNCEYISKEFEINDPTELIYKQSNIIPMASEVT